jgi:hypothetical protein
MASTSFTPRSKSLSPLIARRSTSGSLFAVIGFSVG